MNRNLVLVVLTALVAALIGGSAAYAVLTRTQTETTEIRIVAQRRPGGLIEFAVQQREADGSWGERQEPRANRMRAEGRLERWQVSTPVEIEVEVEIEVAETEAPPVVDEPAGDPLPPSVAMSREAYLELMCGGSIQIDGLPITGAGATITVVPTWQMFFETYDSLSAMFYTIIPPAELGTWHELLIMATSVYAQYALLQPSDALVGPTELLPLTSVMQGEALLTVQSLSAELRAELEAAGCNLSALGGNVSGAG